MDVTIGNCCFDDSNDEISEDSDASSDGLDMNMPGEEDSDSSSDDNMSHNGSAQQLVAHNGRGRGGRRERWTKMW